MSLRALWVGLAVLLTACEPTTSFTTTVKGQTTVRGDPLGAVFSAFPAIGSFANLDFNANQEFKNAGIRKDQVTSVKATEVTLRIRDPDTQDFSFLDSLAFYARAGDKELLVADKADIGHLNLPPPNPTLRLDVKPTAELQPFVAAPSMSVVVRGKGHAPPQDTFVEAAVTFHVEFRLF